MNEFDRARDLLAEFKGGTYVFGAGVLPRVGEVTAQVGRRAALVRGTFPGSDDYVRLIRQSLSAAGVELAGEIKGARPNAPRGDLARITAALQALEPKVLLSFGGGSTIDAVKAAAVLYTLGAGQDPQAQIDSYFGTGLVSQALSQAGRSLPPHVAIQTVASSAAHLTKYSNITDLSTGQKKLIVDEAIVPARPLFDYEVTYSTPPALTADGAMDGLSHCLEVLYGAVGKADYALIEEVATTGISLTINHLPLALDEPRNPQAREALCLATDLGGYAIMLGGTNGAHLMEGRELGVAVAEAMFAFARRIGFPTRLEQVPGFNRAHIERALQAAKNPQLRMKLENMPVPLSPEMVDEYMAPIHHHQG